MKIDSHQHFWHYNLQDYGWMNDAMNIIRRDFLPADLKTLLQENGFSGSVAVQARQSLEETNWLLKLANEHQHILGVVGWVDLCSADAETQISRFAAHPKACGLRHVLHDEPDPHFMLRKDFMRGVNLLPKYNLAYDILIFHSHLENTLQFVDSLSQKQTFVVDHIAKPLISQGVISPWKEHITELAQRANVYCKLSGMITEADWKSWTTDQLKPYLDVVFEAFGPDRLMIGSDWPVCLVAGSYKQTMQVVMDYIAQLNEVEQNKITGGNAKVVYNLN